ncbi:MAG: Transposase [Candidatus Nomurabacteria bacterium GW2011_GWB1_37_5]|uniref:Transposase n=1 Tax=Candidatus Nomurabacteria bacterium GW2011_GWB1_37_5 TaxID=1618742 RepID=A0A0G0K2Q5_9BACT|nr:MAG: Transposase [Candidatus Nomurabacteria bacterium GW2011_GWB1_37_5]
MRKESYGIGNIVHVYNRGNRKQEIVRDNLDRFRFLQALFYFNDEYSCPNPFRTLEDLLKPGFNKTIVWPKEWPKRRPLVKVLAYILKDNHFHLILEEIKENGIARFMHKFGTGVTNRFNTRYQEVGRLFQGPYKLKVVDNNNYLTYLSIYLHIKNAFEIYPGGMNKALKNFDKAYEFAEKYPYSSFADYIVKNKWKIIGQDNLISKLMENKKDFKKLAKNCLFNLEFNEKNMNFSSC